MSSASRCVGLLAHVDAGKTTLTEAMLYLSGSIRKLGRVDHRDSFLDHDDQERARGITIFSKQARLRWKDTEFTILDTPGHIDFSSETERTIQVLDAAVLVISGTDGVQAHTETLWALLQRYRIPTFCFITKMDSSFLSKEELMNDLRTHLSPACVDMTQERAVLDEEAALLDADVFIQTSRHEGMPVGILEAMGYGLPCLVTKGTSLGAEVSEARAGWVAETTAEGIAARLVEAVNDRSYWMQLGSNGRNAVQKRFSWEVVAAETVKKYSEIIRDLNES